MCIEKRLALVTIVFIQITNGDSPNIVPLTPVPQYILFRRDGVILFPEFAKFGVGVYLRNVYIENSFLDKMSSYRSPVVIHHDH